MTPEEAISYLCSLIPKRVRYSDEGCGVQDGFSCASFVRFGYSLVGIELPEDIYQAKDDFVLVTNSSYKPMDLVVIREFILSKRHVGLLTDVSGLYMIHCSQITNGVGRSDLGRDGWRQLSKYVNRHKRLL